MAFNGRWQVLNKILLNFTENDEFVKTKNYNLEDICERFHETLHWTPSDPLGSKTWNQRPKAQDHRLQTQLLPVCRRLTHVSSNFLQHTVVALEHSIKPIEALYH